MNPSCIFISHATARDGKTAAILVERLERAGIRCWIAPRDIPGGASFLEAIRQGIGQAQLTILLLSNSANESPYVLQEVKTSFEAKIPVLTIRLQNVQPSPNLFFLVSSGQFLEHTIGHTAIIRAVRDALERDAPLRARRLRTQEASAEQAELEARMFGPRQPEPVKPEPAKPRSRVHDALRLAEALLESTPSNPVDNQARHTDTKPVAADSDPTGNASLHADVELDSPSSKAADTEVSTLVASALTLVASAFLIGIVFVILMPVLLSGAWLVLGVDHIFGIPVWLVLLYSAPLSLSAIGVTILADDERGSRESLGLPVLAVGLGSFVALTLSATVLSCLSLVLRRDQMFGLSVWHVLLWSALPSLFFLFVVGWIIFNEVF